MFEYFGAYSGMRKVSGHFRRIAQPQRGDPSPHLPRAPKPRSPAFASSRQLFQSSALPCMAVVRFCAIHCEPTQMAVPVHFALVGTYYAWLVIHTTLVGGREGCLNYESGASQGCLTGSWARGFPWMACGI